MDEHVEQVLRVIGYVVASHIMCRATVSRGIGRYETVLTSDIADLMHMFDVIPEYLKSKNSSYEMSLNVVDFGFREAEIGADFILAIHGKDSTSVIGKGDLLKVILIQAKREDYQSQGASYAKSSNHMKHARNMANCVGPENSFFAYYHSQSVMSKHSQKFQQLQIQNLG